jgi:hypothetical protein
MQGRLFTILENWRKILYLIIKKNIVSKRKLSQIVHWSAAVGGAGPNTLNIWENV